MLTVENIFYIYIAIMLSIFIGLNLYWGAFLILLLQPLFITTSTISEGAGYSITKLIFGIVFAIWIVSWALTRVLSQRKARPLLSYPMAAPTLAMGALLGVAIPIGLIYGASLNDIARDLSQYVGYLAVLPLLDAVQTPKRAKKLIFLLAVMGLPSSILTDIGWIGMKQGVELSPTMMLLQYAAPYWGPIQGAIWVVALTFQGFALKFMAWGFLLVRACISLYSGYRYMLLTFVLSGLTAFWLAKGAARYGLARYIVIFFLILSVGGVLADQAGLITLPISDRTRERYATLFSEDTLLGDRSVQGRLLESKALYEAFEKNPIVGIGLGHSLIFVSVDDTMDRFQVRFRYHNGYLETLMKFGLLGALVFAWYFLTLVRLAFQVTRSGNGYFVKAIGLGLVIYLVPTLLASVSGSYFSERGFTLTMGVMGGILPAFQYARARASQPVPAMLRNGKLRQYGLARATGPGGVLRGKRKAVPSEPRTVV